VRKHWTCDDDGVCLSCFIYLFRFLVFSFLLWPPVPSYLLSWPILLSRLYLSSLSLRVVYSLSLCTCIRIVLFNALLSLFYVFLSFIWPRFVVFSRVLIFWSLNPRLILHICRVLRHGHIISLWKNKLLLLWIGYVGRSTMILLGPLLHWYCLTHTLTRYMLYCGP